MALGNRLKRTASIGLGLPFIPKFPQVSGNPGNNKGKRAIIAFSYGAFHTSMVGPGKSKNDARLIRVSVQVASVARSRQSSTLANIETQTASSNDSTLLPR